MEQKLPDDAAAQKAVLEERLRRGVSRMNALERDISSVRRDIAELQEKNRKQDELLDGIHKNTADLVEMWQAGSGTIKVFRWLGKVAVWCGGIASAITAIWYTITSWPKGGL